MPAISATPPGSEGLTGESNPLRTRAQLWAWVYTVLFEHDETTETEAEGKSERDSNGIDTTSDDTPESQ